MTTTIDLNALLAWGPPKPVTTARGDRILHTATATQDFWAAWRSDKQALVSAGISVKKLEDATWQVCWWRDVPPEQRAAKAAKLEASRAGDADIDVPAPPGWNYRPYQKAAIRFALMANGRCLFGDEPGLGKTCEAIGVLNSTPAVEKVLVICPASVKINWERELDRWLLGAKRKLYVMRCGEQTSFFQHLLMKIAEHPVREVDLMTREVRCFIINYDIVHRYKAQLDAVPWDAIICDEAHRIKNPDAQSTRAVYGWEPNKRDLALGKQPIAPLRAKIRLALTGTPMPNRPSEIFTTLHWLDPEEFKSKWSFAFKYCGAVKENGGITFDESRVNMAALQDKLRSTIMCRRLKADVLTELPAKTRELIELEDDDGLAEEEQQAWAAHRAEIDALEATVELRKASGDDYRETVAKLSRNIECGMTAMAALRVRAAQSKLPKVIQYLEEQVESGQKIVVFSHHHLMVEGIHRAFGAKSVKHYGQMSEADKQISVDRFQEDDSVRILSGSVGATREGITLTASSHPVFAEFDWRPGVMDQAADRCHRIGQRDAVLVTHLALRGSLDSNMIRAVLAKQKVLDEALDTMSKPEQQAPITSDHVTITVRELKAQETLMTAEEVQRIHVALRQLAGVCDGAVKQDNVGFNGCDQRIGHALADEQWLTPRQAVLGRKILVKYARQLGISSV